MFDHRITEIFSVLVSCYFPGRSGSMSSQDLKGESFVSHYVANPRTYGDIDPYGWSTEEEQDDNLKKTENVSSDEDDVPLPQPGDMHVEFKKSSLPNTINKSKIQFIPSRFLQESKEALCKKVLKLEEEVDDLREENFILKRKLNKLTIASSSSPSPPKKEA